MTTAAAGAIAEVRPVADARRLAECYWPRAHRFAAMVMRNDQDAADVAQEAIERAMRNLDRFSPVRGSFDAWLWRIVVNTARDAGRASSRRLALFDRLAGMHRARPLDDAETLALERITDQELLAAVRALKPRPRTLVALRFGAQLSFAEIGEQLGISEAAALMATKRSLESLRRTLGEGK